MPSEEQKKNGKSNVCTCGCCSTHTGTGMGCTCGAHGGTRMLFRALLGVIILILVFWFGVRLGELRESIRGYDGYGSGGYYPQVRMMSGFPASATPGAGTTAQ